MSERQDLPKIDFNGVSNLTPYETVKPSGLKWLDQIPEHWKTVDVRKEFDVKRGKTLYMKAEYDSGENVPYYRPHSLFESGSYQVPRDSHFIPLAEVDKCLVQKGDLLVCELGNVGRSSLVKYDVTSPVFFMSSVLRVRPKGENVNAFLNAVLYFARISGYMHAYCHKTTVAHLPVHKFLNFKIPLPPVEEQKIIGDFLQQEYEAIDSRIARFEEIVSKKSSHKKNLDRIIFNLVTKGMNPAAEMVDSETKWMGKVPKHWKVVKMGMEFHIQKGKTLDKSAEYDSAEYIPYYLQNSISEAGSFESPKDRYFLPLSSIKNVQVQKGDVLVCGVGDVGRSSLVKYDVTSPVFFMGNVIRVRPKGDSLNEFLNGVLYAAHALGYMRAYCNKTTMAFLPVHKFSKFKVPLPPVEEQKAIGAEVSRILEKHYNGIAVLKKMIVALKDYRRLLTYNVLTGRVDLRQYKRPDDLFG